MVLVGSILDSNRLPALCGACVVLGLQDFSECLWMRTFRAYRVVSPLRYAVNPRALCIDPCWPKRDKKKPLPRCRDPLSAMIERPGAWHISYAYRKVSAGKASNDGSSLLVKPEIWDCSKEKEYHEPTQLKIFGNKLNHMYNKEDQTRCWLCPKPVHSQQTHP